MIEEQMDTEVLHTLEFNKIIDLLADQAVTIMGKELAAELLPTADFAAVENRLNETREAADILISAPNVPIMGGVVDIRGILKRAQLGAVLEPLEILKVAGVLYAVRRLKKFFSGLPKYYLLLSGRVEKITVFSPLENAIENTLDEHGDIRDSASGELSRLRREVKIAQNRVREKLEGILRSQDNQKYFQDAIVTMRGDRYVIPVKQEYKHVFPGVIHDQSASGATVFIEPMAIVNLNNDIKQLVVAEQVEIERILTVISAAVAKFSPAVLTDCEILAEIDFAFAKAKLAQSMKAERPSLTRKSHINIRRARHPLIPAAEVVPNDIYLGREYSIILITGPNTGGKTVTLKTLGLFALMTQAGLFIPSAPGSEMPVFKNVFADVGDEQSIEQSLSTFSAHMSNLVKILGAIAADDLVLIDEIGAGTDPNEGAALAMAMLEQFLAVGSLVVATTHYSELKTFAYSQPGIENASVEFDVNTLRPTYRLLIGTAGGSNAFAISGRLGLSDLIIDRAKLLMNKEQENFDVIVNELQREKLKYLKLYDDLAAKEREMNVNYKKLADELASLAETRNRLLAKTKEESRIMLRRTRREAEEIIAELKAALSNKDGVKQQQTITAARQRLKHSIGEIEEETTAPEYLPANETVTIKPGDEVLVLKLKHQGTVLAVENSEAIIQLGSMKINVPLTDCRLVKNPPTAKIRAEKNLLIGLPKIAEISRQVDIRGMTVDEAVAILAKYLDDAVLAGLNEVTVIHGKGTGALRKGVRAYLKNHINVMDISIGEINAGGDGATVVKLR